MWMVRVRYVTHDGTAVDWERTFDARPSVQVFPGDGRGLVVGPGHTMHFWAVDWITVAQVEPSTEEITEDCPHAGHCAAGEARRDSALARAFALSHIGPDERAGRDVTCSNEAAALYEDYEDDGTPQ